MNVSLSSDARDEAARRYRRPLLLGIAGAVFAELVIFVVWGVILFPEGDIFTKFLWTIVFCGLGMGSVVGALLVLFVVDRFDGVAGIMATAAISALVLGGACNVLCYRLDSHYFHYFGGGDDPVLFLVNGAVMAALGGAGAGWLMFTERGRALLESWGL